MLFKQLCHPVKLFFPKLQIRHNRLRIRQHRFRCAFGNVEIKSVDWTGDLHYCDRSYSEKVVFNNENVLYKAIDLITEKFPPGWHLLLIIYVEAGGKKKKKNFFFPKKIFFFWLCQKYFFYFSPLRHIVLLDLSSRRDLFGY